VEQPERGVLNCSWESAFDQKPILNWCKCIIAVILPCVTSNRVCFNREEAEAEEEEDAEAEGEKKEGL
jgi:hypothetical protein